MDTGSFIWIPFVPRKNRRVIQVSYFRILGLPKIHSFCSSSEGTLPTPACIVSTFPLMSKDFESPACSEEHLPVT